MANIVEQAIIELQSVYKGGGAKKAKKDLENLKRELKNANGSVQRLQNSLKQLNRVPIAFDDKRAMGGAGGQTTPRKAAIFAANEALREYFNTIKSGKRQLAATEAGLKAQSAVFNKVAANAKVAGDLYVGAVESQTRAEQKLRLAQLERLKVEQDLFSKGRTTKNDAFKGVDELLSMGNKLPRTIGALSLYKSELQQTLRVVEIGSDKYKALERAIEATTQKMQGQQKKKVGLAGLKEALAAAKKEQEELVVGRAGTKEWVEATVRVKKAQFEYNKELAKSRIGIAFINADINGSVKALNLAKQAAKGGLGLLGGVAGAIGGAGKKALGTRLGKIGAARGIDALAKKVPVVDKAFGRLLQKIPLLGKFLNENISVNARWTAQILEGITGVTVAWNGLNQIISAAQAFTAFERQAAIAINRVARMFKEMYNVAGAMMMGLISPGEVGKNLWDQALDRPEVMAARRGPSRLEQRELDQAALKNKIKNAEVNEVQLIEGLNRKLLEVERAITEETRERILIRKKEQQSLMKGPVWTQYGSPAGPGAKGAGFLSSLEGNLGEAKLRLAEKVTTEGKEYENAARSVVQLESRINAELQEREAIYRRLNQGVALTRQQQQDAAMSLAAQRERATTQSPIATRWGDGNAVSLSRGPVRNEVWSRYQRMRQGRMDRRQRFNENMMLGIGFPMLFGGGLGGIAGGAAGAVAQSRMGTKGGFGSQIILSALGQKFDQIVGQMVASTATLGKAMNKYSLNVGEITKSLGVAGTATAQYLQTLEAVKGPMAAANEAQERLRSIIGDKGVADLKEFGERSQSILNSTRKFFTVMTAGLAGILNWADRILGISEGLKKGEIRQFARENDDPVLKDLRAQMAAIKSPKSTGILGPIGLQAIEDDKKRAEIWQKMLDRAEALMKGITPEDVRKNALLPLDNEIENLEKALSLGTRQADIEKEIATILKENNLERGKGNDALILEIEGRVKSKKLLQEQLELWNQIKDTIATGLTSAIEGLIAGTKSLGESLGSIAKSIGSMLLQAGISSWIGGMNFGGGTKVATGPTPPVLKRAQGGYMANGIKPFAYGGIATKPTVGLVGEAGEDEYIIPASKMAASMQRYSAGARGEAVIPGTGSSHVGAGGGASTTVNYSGPILNFNSEEFVPKSAVGQIIASASARGASIGENRTLSTLKNSRSRRSALGL